MSKGYIPKKKLQARKLRKLRKKYDNFSCSTCAKRHFGDCKKRFGASPVMGMFVFHYEKCNEWKAGKEKKKIPEKKKKTLREFLDEIF